MKIDYPPPPTQLLLPRPRSSLPPETNLSNPKEDSRNLLNPKEDLTSCPALDQFCFLQEEQQHVHQTTFSHDPLKIFAHSSTTHNRLLHILHILSQPIKIFARSSTSHNRFLRFLHILPQPTIDFGTFFTFFHNSQRFLYFLPTTHNRFLQILPQNTKDFCCLLRLLLQHTNPIQFHSNKNNKTSNWVTESACNLEQNFELGRQICAQSRTKL